MELKSRWYRGCEIRPCKFPRSVNKGWRWIYQRYHSATGEPFGDIYCPHYHTLAKAKEAISRMLGPEPK